MTRNAARHPVQEQTIRIGHAAVVTTRMPAPEERAKGFPAGEPVMVVSNGPARNVYPHWVTLAFDDPHGQPEPDALRDAVTYVLGIIGEQLSLVGGRVGDLADALWRSPCSVAHLADRVREEEEDAWHCADPGACDLARQPASGRRGGRPGPGQGSQRGRGRARRPGRRRAGRRG